MELVESERIKPSRALDLCCGAGTNPIYLARKGFDVTAMDVSDGAVNLFKERVNNEKIEIIFWWEVFLRFASRISRSSLFLILGISIR